MSFEKLNFNIFCLEIFLPLTSSIFFLSSAPAVPKNSKHVKNRFLPFIIVLLLLVLIELLTIFSFVIIIFCFIHFYSIHVVFICLRYSNCLLNKHHSKHSTWRIYKIFLCFKIMEFLKITTT